MFGSANSKTAPSVSTLRAQSAIYGVVLPTIRGTNRLPAKMIDWSDFIALSHEQAVGGKGMGGGNVTNYTYQAAVDLALAMSPGCVRIGRIWDGQGEYGGGQATEQINIPAGNPGSYTPVAVASDNYSTDIGMALITAEEVWVPAYDPANGLPQSGGAPGVGDGYYETQNVYTPMARVGSSNPGPGQYHVTGSGSSLAYLFNPADAGKPAKLVYALKTDIAGEFTFFNGSRPQTPWAYMLGRYPTRALAYAGTCHVAAESFQLGSSGTLNNLNFELVGPGVFGGGIQDAGIDECIKLVTIDPDGGCGFDSALLGDLSDAIASCAAAGIFFSPICDKQATAASYLQDYCDAANLAICWNDGLLKFIPYGDKPIAGNGFTFIPDLTPIYDLDDDDFLAEEDESPIRVEPADPESLSNVFEVDILDRALSYNTHPIIDRDSALIYRFGRIPESPRKYDFICDVNVGRVVVNHIRLRATQIDALNIIFKLGAQYELLEKMDIVTITAKELGWFKKPFRLKELDDDPETGETEWTAEPVMWGSYNATLYPKQLPGGSSTQRDANPGSILWPIIFEAPDPLVPDGEYQLWLGLCGDTMANWGGCHVYASSDGNTYKNVAGAFGPSRMGVLQADFPAVVGHDLTSTLDVDLAESGAMLLSGTDDDRDSLRTLCWVEGYQGYIFVVHSLGGAWRGIGAPMYELISYKTATLVSGNRYQLTDIQRGVLGTPVLEHKPGMRFLRCDDAVTKLTFTPSDVGKTAHIKATSFNKFGLAEEDLAAVADWPYAIQGYFNNATQFVSNDATVDSIGTSTGGAVTAATVRAYGVGGVGTAVTTVKGDGTKVVIPGPIAFPGLLLSTWYWVMYNPMTATCYVATSLSAMQSAIYSGHICLGATQTVAASGSGGTTGGGGGTSGGGGGGFCPALEMKIDLDTAIADVRAGKSLDCIDPITGVTFEYPINQCKVERFVPCVRLVAQNGAAKVVSYKTPFDLPNGEHRIAVEMLGQLVWTDLGHGTVPHMWRIWRIEDAGLRDVMHIDLGGRTFAAGESARRRIYSHNMSKPLLGLEP